MVSTSNSTVFVSFLDVNCRFKSVATQILHNVRYDIIPIHKARNPSRRGIEPAPHPGNEFKEPCHTARERGAGINNMVILIIINKIMMMMMMMMIIIIIKLIN